MSLKSKWECNSFDLSRKVEKLKGRKVAFDTFRESNMYDEKKIRLLRNGAIALGIIISLVLGFSVGSLTASTKESQVKSHKKVEAKPVGLQASDVKKFTLAYFTKKDLGENRNRYKPLMTDAMYTQSVSEEQTPANQAYKGMVINQVVTDETTYIDVQHLEAIVTVAYKNTQLVNPGNLKTALKDQPNERTVKLGFVKQGNKYLVNSIKWVSLPDGTDSDETTNNEDESSDNTNQSSSSTSTSSSDKNASSDESEDSDTSTTYQVW